MREIKFRGKCLNNGKWVYVDLHQFSGRPDKAIWPIDTDEWEEVDPETVGQFTGLLDKNGKDIYEGDIINAIARIDFESETCISDVICAVEDSSQFCIRAVINDVWARDIYHGLHIRWGGWASLEVIGNIHDNAELLK